MSPQKPLGQMKSNVEIFVTQKNSPLSDYPGGLPFLKIGNSSNVQTSIF